MKKRITRVLMFALLFTLFFGLTALANDRWWESDEYELSVVNISFDHFYNNQRLIPGEIVEIELFATGINAYHAGDDWLQFVPLLIDSERYPAIPLSQFDEAVEWILTIYEPGDSNAPNYGNNVIPTSETGDRLEVNGTRATLFVSDSNVERRIAIEARLVNAQDASRGSIARRSDPVRNWPRITELTQLSQLSQGASGQIPIRISAINIPDGDYFIMPWERDNSLPPGLSFHNPRRVRNLGWEDEYVEFDVGVITMRNGQGTFYLNVNGTTVEDAEIWMRVELFETENLSYMGASKGFNIARSAMYLEVFGHSIQSTPTQVSPSSTHPTNNDISVIINEQPVTFDVAPIMMDGRTMVPMRAIFEALGATLEWDSATRTATATRGSTVVRAVIDSNIINVNGSNITMDIAPVIIDGRTLVPLRFVSEAFGYDVSWDSATRTASIVAE